MMSEVASSRPLDGTRIFRGAMLTPGAVVTLVLVVFALCLVTFLSIRTNDGSLLGAGASARNFAGTSDNFFSKDVNARRRDVRMLW